MQPPKILTMRFDAGLWERIQSWRNTVIPAPTVATAIRHLVEVGLSTKHATQHVKVRK